MATLDNKNTPLIDSNNCPLLPDQEDRLEQAIWDDPALDEAITQYLLQNPDTPNNPENMSQGSTPLNYYHSNRVWLAVAASCMMIMCSYLWIADFSVEKTSSIDYSTQRLSTPVSAPEYFSLSDGSQVNLNADTRLTTSFTPEARKANLHQGEVYFDINKDSERPFVITTSEGIIEVIGTAFNVDNTWNKVEISVYEGVVKVKAKNEKHSLTLTAGERVSIKNGFREEKAQFSVTSGLDWVNGQLAINEKTLHYVVQQLNRYSNKKIVLAPGLGDRKITGSFQLDNIDEALNILAELNQLEISPVQGIFYLRSNK